MGRVGWSVYSICCTRRCCTARTERPVLEMVDILWTIFILRLKLIQAMSRDIIYLMSAACYDILVVVARHLWFGTAHEGQHGCVISFLASDAHWNHSEQWINGLQEVRQPLGKPFIFIFSLEEIPGDRSRLPCSDIWGDFLNHALPRYPVPRL